MENPAIQKLNMYGSVGKPRLNQNNQKQAEVLYGHGGHGKAYTYLAGQNVRTGDIVTPEVTHPKSGKVYKTLARVVATRDALSGPAQNTAGYLANKGIVMKKIGATDQKSLPGYYEGWGKDAKAAQELYNEARVGGASQAKLNEIKNYTDSVRQENKQKYDAQKMRKLNAYGEVPKK